MLFIFFSFFISLGRPFTGAALFLFSWRLKQKGPSGGVGPPSCEGLVQIVRSYNIFNRRRVPPREVLKNVRAYSATTKRMEPIRLPESHIHLGNDSTRLLVGKVSLRGWGTGRIGAGLSLDENRP